MLKYSMLYTIKDTKFIVFLTELPYQSTYKYLPCGFHKFQLGPTGETQSILYKPVDFENVDPFPSTCYYQRT